MDEWDIELYKGREVTVFTVLGEGVVELMMSR